MLLTMKSSTDAMRALALYAAFQLDLAEHHAGRASACGSARARGSTHPHRERLVHRTRQVDDRARHPGARRHGIHRGDGRRAVLRDARITTIYEGTTGIQANDLLGRKIARDRALR